ncbi:Ssl1-like-domain-containing protein [Rhodotorula diobovata]|uniref:General transcription and DNA repair factor IIH n=1 Tax=Rhodotorula diobovata TaxID=5288 RepID=A0A5C5FPY0_9BASI|nr:Ssl1-like-domain-containing protein [Rhodotorula diobovata]
MSKRVSQRDFVVADDDDDELLREDEDESDLDGDSDSSGGIARLRSKGATNRGATQRDAVGTRSATGAARSSKGKGKAWEGQFERTWDQVQEDDRGTLEGAVSDLLLSTKSRRVLRDTSSIQRGIIRHVYLVIDLSSAMLVRDYKATWLDLTVQYAQEFVTEFFDQNPIGQMALMVTRDGLAERLTPLSGNPADHLKVLQNKKKLEARGAPSLQNVLQLAKTGLAHLPPHGSREVIVILGSLTTCDPTNIHQTIVETEKERIRVNIIGLTADMKICRDICDQTKGVYRVARDDLAFRDLLFEFVSPPPTIASSKASSHVLGSTSTNPTSGTSSSSSADLMQMGFPALVHTTYPAVCACHGKLKTSGYSCPRCKARLCDVPTECRVCGLTVVNAPQLARSYRHLFPVRGLFLSFPRGRASSSFLQTDPVSHPLTDPPTCFSCFFPFAPPPTSTSSSSTSATTTAAAAGDLSPLGRYRCPACTRHFCLECDRLVHDALGFCPGCAGSGPGAGRGKGGGEGEGEGA